MKAAKFEITANQWSDNNEEVYRELMTQILTEKKRTWREKKDIELGNCDIPKIGAS